MVGAEHYRDILQRERRNYREEVARVQRTTDQFQRDRTEEWQRRYHRVARLSKNLVRKTQAIWAQENSDFNDLARKALGDLETTRNRYETQMALAAPVKYWKDKSSEHKTAERTMLKSSACYFLVAIISLFLVAYLCSDYILSLPKDIDRAAVYVIVSGGLLAFTTILFWVGRIIIKLYLSEHHLRVDSAERAVMTQTYLAMTEEGSATDAERAIVLTSIFRPSPDGIVKEDGPADASLGGILSRLLTTR
nr:DUF6161 domain-containing protein [Hephaestia mangrovi]